MSKKLDSLFDKWFDELISITKSGDVTEFEIYSFLHSVIDHANDVIDGLGEKWRHNPKPKASDELLDAITKMDELTQRMEKLEPKDHGP